MPSKIKIKALMSLRTSGLKNLQIYLEMESGIKNKNVDSEKINKIYFNGIFIFLIP